MPLLRSLSRSIHERRVLVAMLLLAPLGSVAETADREGRSLAKGALSADQASGYATGLLAVFAVLGVLYLAARWMQARSGQGRGGLRVRACLGLGGKERLMVVDAEGERLLIGVAPGGVHLIRVLEGEPEASAPVHGAWLVRTLSGDQS